MSDRYEHVWDLDNSSRCLTCHEYWRADLKTECPALLRRALDEARAELAAVRRYVGDLDGLLCIDGNDDGDPCPHCLIRDGLPLPCPVTRARRDTGGA